jgi:hypothetical protein
VLNRGATVASLAVGTPTHPIQNDTTRDIDQLDGRYLHTRPAARQQLRTGQARTKVMKLCSVRYLRPRRGRGGSASR